MLADQDLTDGSTAAGDDLCSCSRVIDAVTHFQVQVTPVFLPSWNPCHQVGGGFFTVIIDKLIV